MFWGYSRDSWRALLLGSFFLLLAPIGEALEEDFGLGWLLLLGE